MNYIKWLLPAVMVIMTSNIYANGYYWHFDLGYANLSLSKHDDSVWMNQYMQNHYGIDTQNTGLFGAGISYLWQYNQYAIGFSGSVYYMQSQFSGINTPFVNWSSDTATLNYRAYDRSYALMLEPKFIYTYYDFQPYLLAGAGIAINQLSNYKEQASYSGSVAVPTGNPFVSKTNTDLALEIGIGIQYSLKAYLPKASVAIEYRYFNLGHAALAQAVNTTSNNLFFGNLYASIASASLIWKL
jgi:hypothetical protein